MGSITIFATFTGANVYTTSLRKAVEIAREHADAFRHEVTIKRLEYPRPSVAVMLAMLNGQGCALRQETYRTIQPRRATP